MRQWGRTALGATCQVWSLQRLQPVLSGKTLRLQGPGGLGPHLRWGSILSEVRFQGDSGEVATLPSLGPVCVTHKLP